MGGASRRARRRGLDVLRLDGRAAKRVGALVVNALIMPPIPLPRGDIAPPQLTSMLRAWFSKSTLQRATREKSSRASSQRRSVVVMKRECIGSVRLLGRQMIIEGRPALKARRTASCKPDPWGRPYAWR